MPKKLIAIIIVLALGFLGLFIWSKKSPTTNSKDSLNPTVVNTPTVTPTISAPKVPVKELLVKLLNADTDAGERVSLIADADLTDDEAVEEFVKFIISENPHDIAGVDPHHFIVYQHQREASLRVYALRRLSDSLTVKQFEDVVLMIEKGSPDAAIIRIANQALEFKKNGQNYFEDLKKGIQASPLPTSDDHDGHEH